MAKRPRLTNNSDETEIAQLLSGDTVFSVPYFQRSYKWSSDKLAQFNTDILKVIDVVDNHFLGAVIVHGRRSNPADPSVYDIIDGQQRITTLILYLCAIVRTLCLEEEYDEAAQLFQKYLVIARQTKLPSNMKLHPCKEDRAQINHVYANILSSNEFVAELGGFELKMLPSTGKDTGRIRTNYNSALRFLREQIETESIARIRDVYHAILESMSVVQIDVCDPTNGPKIFDGLNSHQEPMTIGDLVRNEIFSRVASEEPSVIEQIDDQKWQPFYKKFQQDGKNLFDSYFFPFGLTQDSNLRKSEIYTYLRDQWVGEENPATIIKSLAEYQNAFIDLSCGTNGQKHSKAVATVFADLHQSKAPSSTYPFLMQLSNSIRDNVVPEDDGIEIVKMIESFLVRRAVCGHEPTGLHSVFKRLWTDCNGKPTADSVREAIGTHKTVAWPKDEEFAESVKTRQLYGANITPYLLLQFDKSLKGDQPSSVPWVEHVLPSNPVAVWNQTFSKEEQDTLRDTLANLIPLSEEMNRELSNKAYSEKRDKYLADSMFKSTRSFATSHKEWTPSRLKARSNELAKWAVARWPY